jgi:hypothetical protein
LPHEFILYHWGYWEQLLEFRDSQIFVSVSTGMRFSDLLGLECKPQALVSQWCSTTKEAVIRVPRKSTTNSHPAGDASTVVKSGIMWCQTIADYTELFRAALHFGED